MITISLKKVDGSVTRTFNHITVNESNIILDNPNQTTVDECVLAFEKGLLASIKIRQENTGAYTTSNVSEISCLYAQIGGAGLVLGVTTYDTLANKMSGITENAAIVKAVHAKKEQAAQSTLFKGRQQAPQRSRQDLQKAVKATLAARGETEQEKARKELEAKVIARVRRDNARDGKELTEVIKAKSVELVKCGAIMNDNQEWQDLTKMLTGVKFDAATFNEFSKILGETDYQICLKKIRAFADKITFDVNNIVKFK